MELRTGMKIKIFPETDAEAYVRMIKEHGYTATIYRDHITIGMRRKTNELDKEKLARLIRTKRRAAGKTREEVAAELHTVTKNIFEWEIGTKQPKKENLEKLIKILYIEEEEVEKCRI